MDDDDQHEHESREVQPASFQAFDLVGLVFHGAARVADGLVDFFDGLAMTFCAAAGHRRIEAAEREERKTAAEGMAYLLEVRDEQ